MKNDTHIQHFVAPNIDAEVIRRRDMREVFTFTIDPKDAKDFDDALSFEKQEDGTFQVGVHIADVTYFVQPDTDIDKSAYEKATSIYYVDHVVPMLPEELCNNLCSLRPNEDKLTMSVIFTMDQNAKVLKYKICRTVIRSNFRLAYEDAQNILDDSAEVAPLLRHSCELETALKKLNEFAKILRSERMKNGALDIECEPSHRGIYVAG